MILLEFFPIYFFNKINDTIGMVNENTDAQVKAHLISRINKIKPEAIKAGFDYPTQPIETATVEELQAFHDEIQAHAIDAIIAEHEAMVKARS